MPPFVLPGTIRAVVGDNCDGLVMITELLPHVNQADVGSHLDDFERTLRAQRVVRRVDVGIFLRLVAELTVNQGSLPF